jgi:hypothetical protein
VVKQSERVKEKEATAEKQAEVVFESIRAAMPAGIITKDLIDSAPFGKDTVKDRIEYLVLKGRIRVETRGLIKWHFVNDIAAAAA